MRDFSSAMAATTLTPSYINDQFRRLAREAQFSEGDVEALEAYAKKLEDNKVPVIFDVNHLSKLLGYEITLLYAISNAPNKFYRTFTIPKKNGAPRKISEPLPTLKQMQRYILDNILAKVGISKAAKAFRTNSSIKKNARIHLRQPIIIKFDIKDFFPSIKRWRVFSLFFEFGYTSQLSMLLSRMCCLNDCLPQGAPTSPALANIVCRSLDHDLLEYCLQNGLRYTRYADDITISGQVVNTALIRNVRHIVKCHFFELNESKTSVLRGGAKKIVTGIVVNERMQSPRDLRREFRKNVFFIRKYGIDGHLRKIRETRKNYLLHLIGIGEFIRWADRTNMAVIRDLIFLNSLRSSQS